MKHGIRGLFIWKMDEETLQEQLDDYDTLGFRHSYRKISAGWLWLSIVLSILGVMLVPEEVDFGDVDRTISIFLPLSFFVYRGHRWALITAMMLWTLFKGFGCYGDLATSISDPASSIRLPMHLIWWLLWMSCFTRAFAVERARRKLSGASNGPSP